MKNFDAANIYLCTSYVSCFSLLYIQIGFMDWPDPAEPMRVPPSHINPKYVAKESAKRRRLEEVEAAQQQSHVQVSDVTLELIEQLRNEWDGD